MSRAAPGLPPGTACPCGLPATYRDCCGRLHAGAPAASAEALMRSRYSAFALGLADYLRTSWHASTRPATLELAPPQPKWIGLKIVATRALDTDHASVHFIARCRVGGRAERLEETSRFVREHGHWYYVDGDIAD
ncbi:MAG: YchJ family metal-binding protein [Candidatus Dactylopiibacterium sp.]|nr:YchJ family metal-binding protein [Candidatus Dactylopiibacterium sp.]